MSKTLDDWMEVTAQPVAIDEMDRLVQTMQEKWATYEEKKRISTEALKDYEDAENKVLAALKASGKSKWNVDGLGTAYINSKMVVRVPKSTSEKKALFDYISEELGDDVLFNLLSINHQTLNSFYNQEAKAAAESGNAAFSIPGLEAPTAHESVGFRKSR